MRKAFTFVELTITFSILILSVIFLTSLGSSYLSILNSTRTRYLALNFAQEGIEYAIALRNKQIEGSFSPWSGVTTSGSYCLSFDSVNEKIVVNPSSQPCPTDISSYTRLIRYSDFESPTNTDLTNSQAIRVTSEVYFERDQIKLDTVLTRWHPTQ